MRIESSHLAIRFVALLSILVVWEFLAGGIYPSFRPLNPAIVSCPSAIFRDLVAYAESGLLWSDTVSTVGEATVGLVLGIISGVALGFVFAYVRTLEMVFEPFLAALNSLPRPALAPLLILWFGFGVSSKIFLSWSLVFFIMLYNTLFGIRAVEPELLKVFRILNATKSQIVSKLIMPSVGTWIFAALRTVVSYSLIGAVIGEFVGASSGLGYRILISTGTLDTDRTFSVLVCLMAIGVSAAGIARGLERWLLSWHTSARPGLAP